MIVAVVLVIMVFVPPFGPPARASGFEGHRVAAEIAEQYLTPGAAPQVRDLLALDNATTLAEVSGGDPIRW